MAISPDPDSISTLTPDERLRRNVALAKMDRRVMPLPRYNLVVIGAGTAGLVSAAGAAGLGAKVALIERERMGGDCLNYGCVPSKALLRSARAIAAVRDSVRHGVHVSAPRVDFAAIMERMRQIRADLSVNDSIQRFVEMGVDVFAGAAQFSAPDTITVHGQTLRFRRAIIATGARASAPPIPGLAECGYLTNETVFALNELPRRLAIIGAGAVGCELGQAFRRFGAEVTIVEAMPRILPREDRDAAQLIAQVLTREGVALITTAKIERVERRDGAKIIKYRVADKNAEVIADEILIGAGRAPNVENLGLQAAGIDYDRNGITVDDQLRTTTRRVYAAGDVCTAYRFTHMADAMARVALRNALFFGRAKVSALTIPSCVFTDPEIAQVGPTPEEADRRGLRVRTFAQELAGVDRAVIDGEAEGFAKIHVAERNDRILGATIVASHAGELISELTLGIAQGVRLGRIADLIHPYPTRSEAIKKTADAYNRARLTPRVKRIFERWFAWRR